MYSEAVAAVEQTILTIICDYPTGQVLAEENRSKAKQKEAKDQKKREKERSTELEARF